MELLTLAAAVIVQLHVNLKGLQPVVSVAIVFPRSWDLFPLKSVDYSHVFGTAPVPIFSLRLYEEFAILMPVAIGVSVYKISVTRQ